MLKLKETRVYSMESLYSYLGVSRQSVSRFLKSEKEEQDVELKLIDQIIKFREFHPMMGSRSLHYAMNIDQVGINKFEKIISTNGLSIPKTKKRIITTNSKGSSRYPNLINGIKLNNINQLIVADITYYWLNNKWVFIFTLKDVYHQYILSLRVSSTMRVNNALEVIDDFVKLRGNGPFNNLIHHSDNGSQYDANVYKTKLQSLGIKISRAKNSLENGSSENLNGVLKNHYLLNKQFKNIQQMQHELDAIKERLNKEKPIKELNYMTPHEFENHIKTLPENQRPTKLLYDFSKYNGK